MKKLIILLIFLTGGYVFAQTKPSVRLHGYTTYAFADNHVDSYYSETSFFVITKCLSNLAHTSEVTLALSEPFLFIRGPGQ